MKKEEAFYARHFDDLSCDLSTGTNSLSMKDVKIEKLLSEMNAGTKNPSEIQQKKEQDTKRT